jgi:hypothetical protein
MLLNSTAAEFTHTNKWVGNGATDKVITINTDDDINATGNHIAYAFHSVP